ncbi:hypothetical protein CEP54_014646 [Fusarium duplospermum]|uniref:Terpene synthase n=1 Tax=Fusarium duplospermum TaxID=1325734 RepID=A0A428NUX1_9HYPO|nr:hypothetical protein CEP54_014646 [Fusarium duplospermum]
MPSAYALPQVPELVTRFRSWKHPQAAHIFQYSKLSCARSLKEVSEHEVVSRNGEFAACGGLYASWVYPGGNVERLKLVADFYSAWVFLDDLIDNTTDMKYTHDLLDDIRARVVGSRQGHHGLDFMFRLFTHEGWHSELLGLTKAEMDLWLDCTRTLRVMEAEQRIVSVEEYMSYRQTNTAMGMMYLVMLFAMPELNEDFLQLSRSSPDTLRRIFSHCGRSMGVILDLYKLNAPHAQITEYSHIVKMIQHNSNPPLNLQQAVDQSAEVFYEYEGKLAIEFAKVAAFSPGLATAMENVHAGSITWLNMMRGRRYVKKADSSRQPAGWIMFPLIFGGLLLITFVILRLWPSMQYPHFLTRRSGHL